MFVECGSPRATFAVGAVFSTSTVAHTQFMPLSSLHDVPRSNRPKQVLAHCPASIAGLPITLMSHRARCGAMARPSRPDGLDRVDGMMG
jgi:hypothetical protein